MILLISYVSQYYELCLDVEIYADVANKDESYDIIGAVRNWIKNLRYTSIFLRIYLI